MTPVVALLLATWAAIVTVDLATLPQGLLSRPLVAGTVVGWLAGDVAAGAMTGAMLELYALDVMPVGAARYPDYGAATVAAAAAAAFADQTSGALAFAGIIGLPLAAFGGWTLNLHRRINTVRNASAAAEIAAGNVAAIEQVHRSGIRGDMLRGLALGSVAAGAAWATTLVDWVDFPRMEWLAAATCSGGMVAAAGGLLKGTGTVGRAGLIVAGLAIGVLISGGLG